MKAPALSLLIAFSLTATLAHGGETVYRCEDNAGRLAFQDRPCGSPSTETVPLSADPGTAMFGSLEAASAAQHSDWEALQRQQQRERNIRQQRRETQRLLQISGLQRHQQQIAASEARSRCESALLVAHLCGKNAGSFICDENGFVPLGEAATAPAHIPTAAESFSMEQCARQVAG